MASQFSRGSFYGTQTMERTAGTLKLSHLRATVPEHEVREHGHADAHVVLSTRGRYISSAAGEQREGPVLIYNPPGVIHRDRFAGDDGWFFAMSFDADDFCGQDNALLLPQIAVRSHQPAALQSAFHLLNTARWSGATRLDMEVACIALLQQLSDAAPASAKLPAWLKQAQEMIADMSDQELSIADIADAVGVHRVYLARQYQRHLGRSPGSDLRLRRLQRALHFLMTTDTALSDIAAVCGYCDQSHLNRALWQHLRMTPVTFRAAGHSATGYKYPRPHTF